MASVGNSASGVSESADVKLGGTRKSTKTKRLPVLMDIPALSRRVQEIAKTYDPSEPPNPKSAGILYNSLYNALAPYIRRGVQQTVVNNPAYWSKAGIRMEDASTFAQCLESVKDTTKVLGKGMYGTVSEIPVVACMKHIPRGVKHVGVKVEIMRTDVFDARNQMPERLQEVAQIARKAAELGIGPEFYDIFVTHNDAHELIIVKIFESIQGTSWENTEWSSPAKKHEAAERLMKAVNIMNKAGIIHHDIHPGNVMVHTSGKLYIIDYDLARFVNNEEALRVYNFNNALQQNWKKGWEAGSDEGVADIIVKLMEEGSIRVVDANPIPISNTRGKKTRRRHSRS